MFLDIIEDLRYSAAWNYEPDIFRGKLTVTVYLLTIYQNGSLLMWSSTGVSVINYPVRPETEPVTIQERLGSEYILQAKWDGQRIIVLKSNNEVLLYDDPKQRPVIMPNISGTVLHFSH